MFRRGPKGGLAHEGARYLENNLELDKRGAREETEKKFVRRSNAAQRCGMGGRGA